MDIDKIKGYFISPVFLTSIIVVIAAAAAAVILTKTTDKLMKKAKLDAKQMRNIRYGISAVKYIIFIAAALAVLQINGINIGAVAASMGLVSIVVAFAVQDVLKDFVMGINVVTGEFFSVGDLVKYNDITGIVKSFGLRFTKLYNIDTGGYVTVSNRNITEIQILPAWQDIIIPTGYDEDADKVRAVCREICGELETLENVVSAEFLGTDNFGDSSIDYRIRIHCPAEHKYTVRRAALGIIQDTLHENGITIPYRQLDVHVS